MVNVVVHHKDLEGRSSLLRSRAPGLVSPWVRQGHLVFPRIGHFFFLC